MCYTVLLFKCRKQRGEESFIFYFQPNSLFPFFFFFFCNFLLSLHSYLIFCCRCYSSSPHSRCYSIQERKREEKVMRVMTCPNRSEEKGPDEPGMLPMPFSIQPHIPRQLIRLSTHCTPCRLLPTVPCVCVCECR